MSVKLGIAPIAWSNDDMPELGGETSLDQCLSEASEAGFIGIESGGKFPKTSNELLPKLEKYKLNLCSGWYGANLRDNSVEEEKKLISNQLKLFKDCKSPCMVFAEVSGSIQGDPNRKLSTRPQMELDEAKKFYYKISEMGKYLEDQEMPLAYHPEHKFNLYFSSFGNSSLEVFGNLPPDSIPINPASLASDKH